MQKKVLFLVFYDLNIGGVQKKLLDIVSVLNTDTRYKHVSPHLILRDKTDFSMASTSWLRSHQIHFRPTWFNNCIRVPLPVYLLWMACKFKPVAMLTSLHLSSVYGVIVKYTLFWLKIKVVINQDNHPSKDIAKRHSRWLVKTFYPLADAVIVQTKMAKNNLVKVFCVPAGKINVIPNWTLDYKLISIQKDIDILYCGRFARQKNLLKLLETIVFVYKELPFICARLVGDGPEKGKLLAHIKAHSLENNVFLHRPTRSVKKWLCRSKVFCLTSHYEGHSVTLLEAMAMKVVPTCSHFPGLNEYLLHEETGFIESTPKALAAKIITLLKNARMRKKIGNQARKVVISQYGKENLLKYLVLLSIT